MIVTSIYPKISIFIEIEQSWNFCDMTGHFENKWWLRTTFRWYHHVRHINIPQDINFHWNRTKLKFWRYDSHFEKKMVARNKISMVPSCSLHQYTPRYKFSLKSDKVEIFAIWRPFWKKKWWLWTKFQWYHHVRHVKLSQDINFHWNRTKLTFLRNGSHFEKKMVVRYIISIVPSRSPHKIQHVPVGINSLAIILSEILKVKVEKYEKTTLKGQ